MRVATERRFTESSPVDVPETRYAKSGDACTDMKPCQVGLSCNVTTNTYDGDQLMSTTVRAAGTGGAGTGPVVSTASEK